MSSTYSSNYVASNCIDDDLNNFCHTQADTTDPWLSITLSAVTDVFKVVVWNRKDSCCKGRLSPLEVWVGNGLTADLCGGAAVTLPATRGPFDIGCGGLYGSVVTLQLRGTRTLNVAEVYVYRSGLHPSLSLSLSLQPALYSHSPLSRAR